MQYIETLVSSNPNMDRLFKMIMTKNLQTWRKFRDSNEIFKWLHNFHGEDEIYLALILANNIMYYSEDDAAYLWKYLLTNRVKIHLLNNLFEHGIPPANIDKWFYGYLRRNCVFVGYGGAGDSGQGMVYDFKKSIRISGLNFLEKHEFLNGSNDFSNIKFAFLIDDFVGSGNQAVEEWKNNAKGKSFQDIYLEHSEINFVYLALAGYVEGIRFIREKTPIKPIIGEELDEKFKCFSDVSTVYKNPEERSRALKVMREKGMILYEHPLGYKDLQLAVAFYHNTPNNSLPVIWKRGQNGSWYPLFERR